MKSRAETWHPVRGTCLFSGESKARGNTPHEFQFPFKMTSLNCKQDERDKNPEKGLFLPIRKHLFRSKWRKTIQSP